MFQLCKTGLIAAIWILLNISMALSQTDADIPPGKRTVLELYITAEEAWAMYSDDPQKIHIIDVRAPEEYVLVGHPPMAPNIPAAFMTHLFDARQRQYQMRPNPQFVEMMTRRFDRDQTLMLICRSGSRSAWAVNQLARSGYKQVYNILDGFEGDVLNRPGHSEHGRRVVNGWKNANLPWTYNLNPDLVYTPPR